MIHREMVASIDLSSQLRIVRAGKADITNAATLAIARGDKARTERWIGVNTAFDPRQLDHWELLVTEGVGLRQTMKPSQGRSSREDRGTREVSEGVWAVAVLSVSRIEGSAWKPFACRLPRM